MSDREDIPDTNPDFDLKRLKNNKTQLKRELTRFEVFLSKTNLNESIELLQVRYEEIKPILQKFKYAQTAFEEILLSDFPNDYNEEKLAEERDEFETRYYAAMAATHAFFNAQFNQQQQNSTAAISAPPPNPNLSSSIATLPNRSARLPLLTLPEFSGSYRDWQRFRDMFRAIVHNDSTLSDVQRFYYLEASLRGEPKNIIASLSPTDANYGTAWDLLQKRYENKKIIINSHLKEIMEFPALSKESHVSLRHFSNTFFKNYRCLESLGENVNQWNTILIYILVSKLDQNSKKEWEIYCKNIDSPKIDDFNEFLSQRCQMLETLDTKVTLNLNRKSSESRSFITNETNYRRTCPHCKNEHFIYFCDKFKRLSVTDRYNQARKMNLCTNCLRYGHKPSECRSSGCKICQQRHATLLHKPQENAVSNNLNSNFNRVNSKKTHLVQSSNDTLVTETGNASSNSESKTCHEKDQASNVMSNTCQVSSNSFILLSTAIINVHGNQGNTLPCRVLLDSASQSNFITERFLQKLNLNTEKIDMPIIGINQIKTKITHRVEITISSQHTNYSSKLKFLVLPKITEFSPQRYFDKSNFKIPSELPMADPNFNLPDEIDMLLGCEIFFELLCAGQLRLGKNMPIIQKTMFGWIISGQVPHRLDRVGKSDVLLSNCFLSQDSLHEALERFWIVEEIPENPLAIMTKEELECEEHFKKNTTRDETGRFIVKFPLKNNFVELGESEQTALNRLYSIERRLSKNPELENSYRNFMREYENLGHMSEISLNNNCLSKTPIYYIPHHSVERPDSTTTKLRVVFDAACKSSTNLSLNNVLKVGPTIQNDLFSILLRFRKHNFVLIGDITKMYRQILIDKDERNLQRIVWRDTPQDKVRHLQLNTVTYGTASASFLATRCLFEISENIADEFPIESHIIASDFYVDDLLTGSSDLESLLLLKQNIFKILSRYGFELRKFQSNNPKVVDNSQNQEDDNYSLTTSAHVKTLGISWNSHLDEFEYNSENSLFDIENVTKRKILSFVAKIFDPLGILGPLTIRSKLLIQKLWQLKLDWDEGIPSQLYQEWVDLRKEISQVHSVHIPRHILTNNPTIIEMHGFSDASEQAYACCVYIRSKDVNNKIESHLLCAKSRVSPLKSLSLPRLELLGALILARLIAKCSDALKININRTFLWTDSTIVLCWIANEPKTWKTFTANRVAEIQRLTNVENWNYVQSANNPADIISRGSSIKCLIESKLWLHGPAFLVQPNNWPRDSNISNFARNNSNVPEFKTSKLRLPAQILNDEIFKKFSSLDKLLHVVAYCYRFFNNLKLSPDKRKYGKLTVFEMQQCETNLIKVIQSQEFATEIHDLKNKTRVSKRSKLKLLSPFIDQNDIIRVGGRLSNSNSAYESKHPIVLPAKHDFTRFIIDYEHRRTLHSGIQGTLSHIRQKYWPINGKQIVKSFIRKCVTCFKTAPVTIFPKMGDLPSFRVTPARPFLSVAVDYAGPFELKDGKTRTRKIIKGYVCIFVCLVTKAVHIELISDLTSDGFMSLLKRFVSRRGYCSHIYSDNATNFIGSNNQLISIQHLVESGSVRNFVTNSRIQWHFMPAKSPHFGGLHEAAVKSCKHHLKRVLNGVKLNYEEFYTLIVQIEAILNSRPLIPMSSDPNDLSAITAAHFLIGQELTAIPERDVTKDKVNLVKRYRHLQLMGQHFWARWQKEYLHHLQLRSKWHFQGNFKLQVGSLVLLKEDNVPPMCWPLGRITEIFPGKDQIVRVVSVRTKSGIFKRAVTKVALLPVE